MQEIPELGFPALIFFTDKLATKTRIPGTRNKYMSPEYYKNRWLSKKPGTVSFLLPLYYKLK
jgi:hypothetical protein